MPPCFDIYVWIESDNQSQAVTRFIDRYVDRANPGDPRFEAFIRTFVADDPLPEDAENLAELRRDTHADTAFTLYLKANGFHEAIVTLTEEGTLVLGLGLDDPMNDPDVRRRAAEVLARLVEEFDARAGIGGVELPPPQCRSEWADDGLVMLRVGTI